MSEVSQLQKKVSPLIGGEDCSHLCPLWELGKLPGGIYGSTAQGFIAGLWQFTGVTIVLIWPRYGPALELTEKLNSNDSI